MENQNKSQKEKFYIAQKSNVLLKYTLKVNTRI
jgi:hypothetical protein